MCCSSSLEIRHLSPSWGDALFNFFLELRASGDDKYFHPHPLTKKEAFNIVNYKGKDIYRVMTDANKIIGYGILRGWDEGYEVPFLGIAISPRKRGRGAGKLLIRFLHDVARNKKAQIIRLKVYKDNEVAIKIYKSFGYRFEQLNDKELIGTFKL